MYNYRYETNISYHKNPSYIFHDSVVFSKNKLAADYDHPCYDQHKPVQE